MGISSRAVGAQLGVSHTAVNYAARRGRIPRLPDGTFDLDQVKAAWVANADVDQRRRGVKHTAKAEKQPHRKPAAKVGDIIPVTPGDGTLAGVQLQRDLIRVKKEQIELDEMEGKLIRVEDVREAWSKVISAAKTRLLAIGNKLGPHLAVEDRPAVCQQMVSDEINAALSELAQYRA